MESSKKHTKKNIIQTLVFDFDNRPETPNEIRDLFIKMSTEFEHCAMIFKPSSSSFASSSSTHSSPQLPSSSSNSILSTLTTSVRSAVTSVGSATIDKVTTIASKVTGATDTEERLSSLGYNDED